MKTTALTLVALILATLSGLCDIDLENGLMAHYTLDGHANDSSGADLHGTIVNAVATSDRFGATNSAFYFDGDFDYLDMQERPNWGFGTNELSVSLWLKADGIATRKLGIFTVRSGHNKVDFSIGYGNTFNVPEAPNDKIGLSLDYYPSPPWPFDEIGSQSLTDDAWHHVAVTRSGDLWNLYMDGNENPVISGTYAFDADPGQLVIGSHLPTDRFFKGAIDDVRIYDRPLNINEIAFLADRPVITGYENGQLTWTNVLPDRYYTVEWCPTLTPSNTWRSSYDSLRNLQSTNAGLTVDVPMFFRILSTTNQVN